MAVLLVLLLEVMLIMKCKTVQSSDTSAPICSEDKNVKVKERYFLADNLLSCCSLTKPNLEAEKSYDYCKINLQMNETVRMNYCVTYSQNSNLTEVGNCIFGHEALNGNLIRNSSELNDYMCGDEYNRDGTLCGKCKDGYYPLAYSYRMNCVQCPNGKSNWWKYVLAAFFPLTVFTFVVLFLNISITSSHMHGFVFFAQAISMTSIVRMQLVANRDSTAFLWLASLYSLWNLDFFRSFPGTCLGTDTLQTLALDYVIGIYPLMLLIFSYISITLHDQNFRPLVVIWKPLNTIFSLFSSSWEIKTSLIDSFATFFLLSNVKILSVTTDLLIPVKVYQLDSTGHLTYSWRLYFDATITYFGPKHLPYAVMAILMLIFVLLPIFVLLLYPLTCFQKLLNLAPVRWYILHTFVDSFQGCYKDGTQTGTRDCRWFASLFLLARLAMFITGILTINIMYFAYSTFILILVFILIVSIQPFKKNFRHNSYTNAFFIFLLSTWNIGILELCYTRRSLILLGSVGIVPILCMFAIILRWMYRNRKFGTEFVNRFRAWRGGYNFELLR